MIDGGIFREPSIGRQSVVVGVVSYDVVYPLMLIAMMTCRHIIVIVICVVNGGAVIARGRREDGMTPLRR